MMRLLLILACLLIVANCYSQGEFKGYKGNKHDLLTNLAFSKQTRILYGGKSDFQLFGDTSLFDVFKINSRIQVQVRESLYGFRDKWANRNARFKLYCRQDSNCVFLDTILRRIRGDLKDIKDYNNKHDRPLDDFSENWTLGINRGWLCGAFVCNEFFVPYVMTPHQHTGAFYIIWIDKRIFYLELTGRRKGLGLMSNFMSNSISLKRGEKTVGFTYARSISQIEELAKEIENMYLLIK